MAVESDVLALFRRFAELPTFSAGSLSINGDVMTVSTTLSVATHSSSAFERETHVQTHTLVTEPKLKLLASSTPVPLGKDVLHQSISPSGRRLAVFRKLTKEGKGLRLAVFDTPFVHHVGLSRHRSAMRLGLERRASLSCIDQPSQFRKSAPSRLARTRAA